PARRSPSFSFGLKPMQSIGARLSAFGPKPDALRPPESDQNVIRKVPCCTALGCFPSLMGFLPYLKFLLRDIAILRSRSMQTVLALGAREWGFSVRLVAKYLEQARHFDVLAK